MEVRNWGSSENGAKIAEVSEGTSLVSSSASNLLNPSEDLLWIAGSVPQHVTLKLSPTHPPLRYAGWHVWHDYPTNPSKVEISSGESPDGLTPLLVCRALPGAGTQLWLLPKPIPPQHLYVKLRITESFSAGPTYMSTVVLLANDPGPNYRGGALPAARIGVPEPPPLDDAATTSPRAPDVPPRILVRHGRTEQLPHRGTTPNLASAEQSYTVFNPGGTSSGEPMGGTDQLASASAPKSTGSRIGKLLKDLEEDIRNLHPIKGVRPPPNMLLAAPRGASLLSPSTTETSNSLSIEGEGNRADTHPARGEGRRSPRSQKKVHEELPAAAPHHCCTGAVVWGGRQGAVGALPPQLFASVAKLDDRINILEQTVASLTQTVQHQREDLTMMKRLLLHQAIEQRKESEWRHNAHREGEQRRAGTLLPMNSLDHKLTHHQIDVNFPEEALREYVESIMEERLQTQLKKSESKILRRLDIYLKDVVRCITDSVDVHLNHVFQQQLKGPNLPPSEILKHLTHAGSNATTEVPYGKNGNVTALNHAGIPPGTA
ncbi:unnamed protein product [Phytomonas sp. EM1]|nr:unnamed protein product [Phytomonas sp. EM1]|eukprot:CCW60940.1 unnamed protein product [Phytomonas sp. isolate EM1]